jgi:hypothetical protein
VQSTFLFPLVALFTLPLFSDADRHRIGALVLVNVRRAGQDR